MRRLLSWACLSTAMIFSVAHADELLVLRAFEQYRPGQTITDEPTIQSILNGPYAGYVIHVNPGNGSGPTPPPTTAPTVTATYQGAPTSLLLGSGLSTDGTSLIIPSGSITAAMLAPGAALPVNNPTATGTTTLSGGTLNLGSPNGGDPYINADGPGGHFFFDLGNSSSTFRVSGTHGSVIDIESGYVQTHQPLYLGPPTTWSNLYASAGFEENQSITGSSSASTFYNLLQVTDNVVDTSSSGSAVLAITQILGASASGNKNPLLVSLDIPVTPATGGEAYVAAQFTVNATANANGTSGNLLGNIVAINPVAFISSAAATYYAGVAGEEIDVAAAATPGGKAGLAIVLTANDTMQSPGGAGGNDDIALTINNQYPQTAAGRGWKTGIDFGSKGGGFPMDTLGTLINAATASGTMLVANGINWSGVTFSGNSWNDGHVSFSGAGDVLLNSASALATNATAGFVHLPHTTAAPTGTPANTTPGCEWNTATHVLNCYDGSAWYHFTGVAGAG